jgi:hypothetical protein
MKPGASAFFWLAAGSFNFVLLCGHEQKLLGIKQGEGNGEGFYLIFKNISEPVCKDS